MGLKTIVRAELKLRGLEWAQKAPQATPNKREAARLSARQRHREALLSSNRTLTVEGNRMPGSYRK
jgi:hypothetical protein